MFLFMKQCIYTVKQAGYSEDAVFTKGEDVLDIWFDSGSTWSHVLKGTLLNCVKD